jgi:hypothetical protein
MPTVRRGGQLRRRVDVLELSVAIRVLAALDSFRRRLEAVSKLLQQGSNGPVANPVPLSV